MWPWPWRRRVEVVLAAEAGDDTVASLTTILRYHKRSVTFDDVSRAIYEDGVDPPTALQVVRAAESFRLRVQGLAIDHWRLLEKLPTPSIAHMLRTRGKFPRDQAEWHNGYFAVLAATSTRNVRLIDPYSGPAVLSHAAFLKMSSGVFLIFDQADTLPHAKLVGHT